jgi:hypothetical protein
MKFNLSILEYLGKIEEGILVLISIVYNDKYYESTYFYTTDQIVLTVSEELEADLGHKIQDDPEYTEVIKFLLRKVVPYNEMIKRIDEVDFRRWIISQDTDND